MLGTDKQIRSSIAVKDVIGVVDAQGISRLVQGKCEAGHLRVDASSKNRQRWCDQKTLDSRTDRDSGIFCY